MECRICQGLWKQERESQPENHSSHGLLLSPPVAYKMLLFHPLLSVSGLKKKEQLENTCLKAVVKQVRSAYMEDKQSNSHFLLEGFSHTDNKISEGLSLK